MQGNADQASDIPSDRPPALVRILLGDVLAITSATALAVLIMLGALLASGRSIAPRVDSAVFTLKSGATIHASSEEEYRRVLVERRGEIAQCDISTSLNPSWFRSIVPATTIWMVLLSSYVSVRNRSDLRGWLQVTPKKIVAGVGLGLILVVIGEAYERVLRVIGTPQIPSDWLAKVAPDKWLLVVLAGLAAPIAEELYFRGRLFNLLLKSLSFRGAILGTAIVFGALHLLPQYLPIYILFGIVLAFARFKSAGLIVPILAHSVNNLIALWLQ